MKLQKLIQDATCKLCNTPVAAFTFGHVMYNAIIDKQDVYHVSCSVYLMEKLQGQEKEQAEPQITLAPGYCAPVRCTRCGMLRSDHSVRKTSMTKKTTYHCPGIDGTGMYTPPKSPYCAGVVLHGEVFTHFTFQFTPAQILKALPINMGLNLDQVYVYDAVLETTGIAINTKTP